MQIAERILLCLSRPAESHHHAQAEHEWNPDNALSLLVREFPDFDNLVSGNRIVDLGCGLGYQSVALALQRNCYVVGIETNHKALRKAIDLAKSSNVAEERLLFIDSVSDEMRNSFDLVISQNSMEHFEDPVAVINEMVSLIHDSGKLLITFGPPWLAPYGSHMHFFCKVPWINILFSERTVMKVRSNFRSDGATKYEEVESGLNKMSVTKFERIVANAKLKIDFRKYSCVKGFNFLGKLPLIRELFINHISCVLTKN